MRVYADIYGKIVFVERKTGSSHCSCLFVEILRQFFAVVYVIQFLLVFVNYILVIFVFTLNWLFLIGNSVYVV